MDGIYQQPNSYQGAADGKANANSAGNEITSIIDGLTGGKLGDLANLGLRDDQTLEARKRKKNGGKGKAGAAGAGAGAAGAGAAAAGANGTSAAASTGASAGAGSAAAAGGDVRIPELGNKIMSTLLTEPLGICQSRRE